MSDAMKQDLGPHLDLLQIDAVRAGEATPEEEAHCAKCAECAATLAGLKGFEAELKAAQPKTVDVPSEIDQSVFQGFEKMLKPQPKAKVIQFPLWRRWVAPAAGLAAAAAFVFAVTLPLLREELPKAEAPAVAGKSEHLMMKEKRAAMPEVVGKEVVDKMADAGAGVDINGDGVTDILDAFKLARLIGEDSQAAKSWDLNSDGVVDQADVDQAARMAVSLGG